MTFMYFIAAFALIGLAAYYNVDRIEEWGEKHLGIKKRLRNKTCCVLSRD
ncbi:hypothetical protein [Vibrio rumoiensis]|nr:hypothetical protein [Vibrio rumoiensis]